MTQRGRVHEPDLEDELIEGWIEDEPEDWQDDELEREDASDGDDVLTAADTVTILQAAAAEAAPSWYRGGRILVPTVMTCRVCGCTDDRGCAGGCLWVAPDLCSRCARAESV